MNAVEVLILMSGLSQKDFSIKVSIPASNLSEIKKGKRDLPLSKFILWCELLNILPEDVFKELRKTVK